MTAPPTTSSHCSVGLMFSLLFTVSLQDCLFGEALSSAHWPCPRPRRAAVASRDEFPRIIEHVIHGLSGQGASRRLTPHSECFQHKAVELRYVQFVWAGAWLAKWIGSRIIVASLAFMPGAFVLVLLFSAFTPHQPE
jgi:hypothetical protein